MVASVSQKAANLIGSEIIRLAGEINQKIREGHQIFNLTIGDFNPTLFPVPDALKEEIIKAYHGNQTNYPPAEGMLELRESVAKMIKRTLGLDYPADQYLIAGGGRPLIYAVYQTLIDPGDKILYPVPSWNNNHYTHLSDGVSIEVETKAENGFLPTAEELEPYIKDVTLLALCSPLNPTGTTFAKEQLQGICEMVINENNRRGSDQKPLYVLYDQIYWMLTMEGMRHYDPVSLNPAMRNYTIFVDGISKSLAATGVRIGWSMGPAPVIAKMKSILGHVGAWAPKAEQVACSNFLNAGNALDPFIESLKAKVNDRFIALYEGFSALKEDGFPVNMIPPQGAIYLTVQFALKEHVSKDGKKIESTQDICNFLLEESQLAVVPFTAFGCNAGTDWFRMSVGTLKMEEISGLLGRLREVLGQLRKPGK